MINFATLKTTLGPKIRPPWTRLSISTIIQPDGTVLHTGDMDWSCHHLSGSITEDGWITGAILFVPGCGVEETCSVIQCVTGLKVKNAAKPWSQKDWVGVEPLYVGPRVFEEGVEFHEKREAEWIRQDRIKRASELLDLVSPEDRAELLRRF